MPPPSDDDYVPDPRRWRILAVLLVAIFMSLVGVSVVNVALPSIQQGLGAGQSDLQWVLAGYALTFGVVLVPAGRAGDIFGRGVLFIAGVLVFTGSSVAAGLAPDALWLNAARFVQGIGAGLINPQGVGMIQQYFRDAERARAFGLFGSTVGVSTAVGPLVGGLLIEAFGQQDGWRWTFLINVPVGIAAVLLALRWFPRPLAAPAGGRASAGRDLDPVGALLLGAAVLAVLLPFVQGNGSPWSWTALPAGLALLALWVGWERRYRLSGRSPMVDLQLFRTRSFTNGTVIAFLYFMGITSVWVLVALYLQNGLGYSALVSGLAGVPASIAAAVSANVSGRLVTRHGGRVVVYGIGCCMAGLALSVLVVLLHGSGRAGIWWLPATLSLVGLAQGAVVSPNQTLALAEVPLRYAGSSGGVLQTGQRIGTSMGIAMVTAVFFAALAATDWDTAVAAGFSCIGAVVLLSLLVALREQRITRRGTPGPPS